MQNTHKKTREKILLTVSTIHRFNYGNTSLNVLVQNGSANFILSNTHKLFDSKVSRMLCRAIKCY